MTIRGTVVSIPQSGFGAFEPLGERRGTQGRCPVSIPQSGFGAFEQILRPGYRGAGSLFQSLSRDSGRLNLYDYGQVCTVCTGFNPSVGIRGV